MNTEEQAIYKIIQNLQERIGLKGRWYAHQGNQRTDGQLELKSGQTKYMFEVEFKREIKAAQFPKFKELNETDGNLLILAETIYPAVREQLRALAINYADTAGNCYIKKNDWLFFIDGFKTETATAIKKDRAFNKTGLLLLFHFLNDQAYLNATYRQMADDYDIALGNVNYIIKSLKDQGFIIQVNKKDLRLTKKRELLDAWITAYEEKLKPVLKIGEFKFLNGNEKEWKKVRMNNYETQWGGEPAAALLTGYLKPTHFVLYTAETKPQLIKKYKLIPQEKGTLSIYKKFWKFTQNQEDTVPPLLVYADLINTGDPRNIETAQLLYDAKLKDQF